MADTSRHHILAVPRPFLGLRALQLVLAIVVLGMSAYGLNYADYDGFSLSLFTAIATMILTVYIMVATLFVPLIYNYWAILALDIFGIIFWLSSFALMAKEASDFHVYHYSDLAFIFKRALGIQKRDTTSPTTYKHVMTANAVMGALEFVLFIITLVLTVLYLLRHRKNGGHSMYNRGIGGPTGGPAVAPAAPGHNTEMPTYGGETKTVPQDTLPLHHPEPAVHHPTPATGPDTLPVQHPAPATNTTV